MITVALAKPGKIMRPLLSARRMVVVIKTLLFH
jgi:hypothetical protein